MKDLYFYMHGGSANHGCEAIVRSACNIIGSENVLLSLNTQEDTCFGLDKILKIESVNEIKKYSLRHILYKLGSVFTSNTVQYNRYKYSSIFKAKPKIACSIGGDNYCSYGMENMLMELNKEFNRSGIKTVLFGCSIEPNMLKLPKIVEDMKRYSLITPRESITYKALIEAGVTKNTKLFPDPAFTLKTVNLELPNIFLPNNTIGINISPLIQGVEGQKNITYKNYRNLIKYIFQNTENNVALIPHVVCNNNNDLVPLTQLYNEFKDTGRVVLIGNHNCMELKGFISHCRFFIGARTHATIAAYSSCVPTLVVGYSIKAKGIAKDIFGTYENYVLPVQSLKGENDLTNAFIWISEHEDNIRTYLQEFMPLYIEKAWQAGEEVKKLMESKENNN